MFQKKVENDNSCLKSFFMILEIMIILITHNKTTLGAIEGQVLDDSKNTNITKEEDESCQFISNLSISNHDYSYRIGNTS